MTGKIEFGKAGLIQWIFAGGTILLLPNYTDCTWSPTATTTDTTSGAATWDTHDTSRQGWEASMTLFLDSSSSPNTGGTADLAKLITNSQGVIVISPLGTATGSSKYGGSATVTKGDMKMPFADPIVIDLTFKGNGQPYWNHGSAW